MATVDHNIEIGAATTEAAHDDCHSAHRGHSHRPCTVTHHTIHTADCLHIAALQVINPEITVGHTHDYPTDIQGMNHTDDIHTPSRMRRRPHPKKNMKVKIEDLHTDYYSSDDHSSDLGEESDPLN